jgi:uncharacterized protein (TIGR00269 family)
VERAVKKFKMLTPGQKVLVAVSGGKDSIALWDAILSLGYEAEGLHLDLGLEEYSEASRKACLQFARNKGAKLYVVSFPAITQKSIAEIARKVRLPNCSVCGVIRRHLMNVLAAETGHRVVATGHNMDDEAAALLGNILNWQEGYLARQHPHLPAYGRYFSARIKPLVRLSEGEIVSYCRLRGLNYFGGRCPFAKGASSLVYKRIMGELEEEMPGTKHRFLFGFLKKEQQRFVTTSPEMKECQICHHPTTSEVCVFCRLMQNAGIEPNLTYKPEVFTPETVIEFTGERCD